MGKKQLPHFCEDFNYSDTHVKSPFTFQNIWQHQHAMFGKCIR